MKCLWSRHGRQQGRQKDVVRLRDICPKLCSLSRRCAWHGREIQAFECHRKPLGGAIGAPLGSAVSGFLGAADVEHGFCQAAQQESPLGIGCLCQAKSFSVVFFSSSIIAFVPISNSSDVGNKAPPRFQRFLPPLSCFLKTAMALSVVAEPDVIVAEGFENEFDNREVFETKLFIYGNCILICSQRSSRLQLCNGWLYGLINIKTARTQVRQQHFAILWQKFLRYASRPPLNFRREILAF